MVILTEDVIGRHFRARDEQSGLLLQRATNSVGYQSKGLSCQENPGMFEGLVVTTKKFIAYLHVSDFSGKISDDYQPTRSDWI